MLKKIKSNLKKRTITFLDSALHKLKNNEPIKGKYSSLAPRVLPDSTSKVYIHAISEALSKPNITNIAITGSYGSGKSSVLKTFRHKFENKFKILQISLASFEDQSTSKQKDLQKHLELSILQQIFYHVSPDKIKDSRFKQIVIFKDGKLLFYSLALLLWFFSIIQVFNHKLLQFIDPSTWTLDWNDLKIYSLLYLLIFVTGAIILTKKLIKFLYNSKITRINLKGEIELGKDIKESILNEHLDEVVYFFEKNPIEVLIIEDLDRFDNTEIFSKLREINVILNNSKRRKNKKLVFIYAVKDDIFKSSARTKFFDFIVPIIPVINPSNSNEILKGFLKKLGNVDKPSTNFIDDISILIKDMRLLLNIWNEYLIYQDVLKSKLSQDNLLAIIIYKNLLPDDFIKLNAGEGILYHIINSKNEYLSNLSDIYKADIIEARNKIEKIEKEELNSLEELRKVYVSSLYEFPGDPVDILIDHHRYSFKDLLEEDNFEKLKSGENIQFIIKNRNNPNSLTSSNIKKTFLDIEKNVPNSLSYENRVKSIENKNEKDLKALRSDISRLQREILKLKKQNIGKVVSQFDNKSLQTIYRKPLFKSDKKYEKSINEEKENLIIFFIKNGYIDEHYYYFISHFYDVTLNHDEYNYIQNVLKGKSSPFDQRIENPTDVIRRIQDRYFDSHAILNNSIVHTLLSDKNYKNRLQSVIGVLSDSSENSKEFINQYIEENRSSGSLISELSKNWSELWNFVETSTEFSVKHKLKYLRLILQNAKTDDIIKLSDQSLLKEFTEDQFNINNWIPNHVELSKIEEVFNGLNIKISSLELPNSEISNSKKLFEVILKKEFYKINLANISTIIKHILPDTSKEAIKNSNYTCVLSTDNNYFINYIDKKINDYLDLWYKLGCNQETEKAIITLLNHDNLDKVWQEDIIIKSEKIIFNLKDIKDNDCKKLLLHYEQIEVKWANIIDYHSSTKDNTEIDEELFNYLNKLEIARKLCKDDYLIEEENQDNEDVTYLSMSILYEKRFEIDIYNLYLEKILVEWDDIDFKLLSYDQSELIIAKKLIKISQKYYEDLQEFHDPLHIKLIENNWTGFFNHLDLYSLTDGDIYQILQSSKINSDNKIDYILKTDEERIVEDGQIRDSVTRLISQNPRKISYNFLSGLFQSKDLLEEKLSLLIYHLADLTNSELVALVKKLGGKYPYFFKKQNKKRVKKTKSNEILIDALNDRGLIHRYIDLGDEIRVHANY